MACIDACAAGLPVVATAVGGTPEIVINEQTGLLVPPQDPNALAQAIVRLAKDRELAERLARAAKARARAEFSAEVMAHRYAELYAAVLGESS